MERYIYLIRTLLLLFVSITFELSAQVSINNNGGVIPGSAMLDISASDKGLLIPRITTESRDLIPSPATGLLIYNTTTNHFNYYNGSYWYQIESSFVSANFGTISAGGGVSVSTVLNRVADNSAMLDVSDPVRGFLPTRTTTGSIVSPDNGLIIYDLSDNLLKYYFDNVWYPVCAVTTGAPGATGSQSAKGVAINTTGAAPHESAILDVTSNNKGLLIPRLTVEQRDAIYPATGLTIFNTLAKTIEYFDGTKWLKMDVIVPAGVSISATAITVCAGTAVTFTAIPFHGGLTPAYQWKIGGADVPGATNVTFTHTPVDNDMVTCKMTSSSPCVTGNPATSNAIVMTVNPLEPVSISISASANPVCAGTLVTFTATPTNGGTLPGYQWVLNGNDVPGATNATYSRTPILNDGISCRLTSNATCAVGSPATSNTVIMIVNPLLPVSITITPSASTVCAGTSVTFSSAIVNGGPSPAYQWKVNGTNVQGATNASFSYIPVQSDAITCKLTSNAICATGNPATSNTVVMTVHPLLPVSITIASSANPVCAGTTVTFTSTIQNGGTSPAYQWKVNGTDVQGATNATYSYVPIHNDLVKCTLTSDATCPINNPAISNTVVMTVHPLLPVSITIAPSANPVCAGTAVTYTSNILNGGPSPDYQWQVNGINIQGATNATYSFVPVNDDIVKCVLTSDATCAINNPATSNPVVMTVYPIPTVNPVNNETYCNNTITAEINFDSPVAGTTFAWTNNKPSIGLPASGAGKIPSFTTANTGTTPVVATITVIPSANGCTGTPLVFTLTIYPTATVTTVSNADYCNGATTTAITFGSPVAGASYAWANNTPSIGLAANGTGNIPSFTAINTGTAPVVATITVTPTANGCIGTPAEFAIVVFPTSTVNPVNNADYCNGATTTAITFTSPVAGTTFAWVNNTPSIGLAANGTGNIPSFTTINTVIAPVTATITVTPSANGCTGTPLQFTITVYPTSTVTPVNNVTYCNEATTTGITFSSPVAGTTFAWANNTPSIGLAANGTGNIPSFTAINTGIAPVTATITVTPTANGCTGTPRVFTITVYPTSTVNPVNNEAYCNGATTTAITFTSPVAGTTFAWVNNTPSIGLAANGSGNIPSFTALNTGIAPVIATITVIPTANGCTGTSRAFTITVFPTSTVNPVNNAAYCNEAITSAITLGSPVAGTTFTWTNNTPSIGLAANGIGNIPSFTAINTGIAPVIATITVTPTANGCTGTPLAFTFTVNPTSTVNPVSNAIYCNGAITTAITFDSPVAGTTFAWTNNKPSIGLPASGTGNIPSFTATNPGTAPVIATITVTPTANGCIGIPMTFIFTVNHSLPVSITIAPSANSVCAGTSVTFTRSVVNGGTAPTYQWKLNGTAITGATNTTYAYVPVNSDVISCVVTSNATCATQNPATSNPVTMTVIPLVPVSVSITASLYAMMPGTSVTFTAATPVNGGTNPTYQWNVNTINITGATNNTFTYTPLNFDRVKCVVTSNSTVACLSNNPASSNTLSMIVYVTGVPCTSQPTVSYGGLTYNSVQIGNQCWLRENLNIGNRINNTVTQTNNSVIEKYCYNDSTLNCDVYGGLYQWGELMQYVTTAGAQGICPTGWHVPTDAEFNTLVTFLGGSTVSGGKLKEIGFNHWKSNTLGGATNEVGFTKLPNGYSAVGPLVYGGMYRYGYIYTSTQVTTTTAYYWTFSYSTPSQNKLQNYKTTATAVRCLKN